MSHRPYPDAARTLRQLARHPHPVPQARIRLDGTTTSAVRSLTDGLANLFMRLGPPQQHCPFCKIVRGEAPAAIVREWPSALAIVPLDPVVDGHLLVLPKRHVRDAAEDPDVTAGAARCAAELARETSDGNLITSIGPAATQTVYHLHWHLVPRAEGDGLHLPWTGQHTSKEPPK